MNFPEDISAISGTAWQSAGVDFNSPHERGASSSNRPGIEQFSHAVWVPDVSTPGLFQASRTEGRPAFFDQHGTHFKRLDRVGKLARIGAAHSLLAASGIYIGSETSNERPRCKTITLATDTLATVRRKTNILAEAGVVTPGPRMRVGLHTTSRLFSMRALVEATHNRTVLISCPSSDNPETEDRANNVEKTHDILDHAAAALVRSDEIVQLEVRETGKRLQGVPPGMNSDEIQNYASAYDATSTVQGTLELLEGHTTNYPSWQYLWGVNDAEMPGIIERWRKQLDGLLVPQS